jgi:hypothetical protein
VVAFAALHLLAEEVVEVSWWDVTVQVFEPTRAALKSLSLESNCSLVEVVYRVECLRTNQSRQSLE